MYLRQYGLGCAKPLLPSFRAQTPSDSPWPKVPFSTERSSVPGKGQCCQTEQHCSSCLPSTETWELLCTCSLQLSWRVAMRCKYRDYIVQKTRKQMENFNLPRRKRGFVYRASTWIWLKVELWGSCVSFQLRLNCFSKVHLKTAENRLNCIFCILLFWSLAVLIRREKLCLNKQK